MLHLTRVGLLSLFRILLKLRNDGSTLLFVMIVGLDLPLRAFLLMVCLEKGLVILCADLLIFSVRSGRSHMGLYELFESQAFFCHSYGLNVVCEGCTGQVENFQSY